MQKKNAAKKGEEPKLAKGMTQEEWIDTLAQIIKRSWEIWGDDDTFHTVIFMFDNPRFHQMDPADLDRLLLEGYLKSADQLQHAPRYSGDYMQCIEHVHSIICKKWWRKRVVMGCGPDWQAWEQELRSIFFATINAKGVWDNCEKVQELMKYVIKKGTGGYAPANLV